MIKKQTKNPQTELCRTLHVIWARFSEAVDQERALSPADIPARFGTAVCASSGKLEELFSFLFLFSVCVTF